ncbi:MAG: acetylornithine/succinylornithine family transaminase [Trueperaceae bacterium]|nr:acetylornithine/succinylornithine family transaminase [Trueperaceae bacterium]
MTQVSSKTQDVLARDARHNSGLWAPDIVFVRGQGATLWDAEGNEYIDCMAGIAVASVGHANAHLAQAIAKQAQALIVAPQNLGSDVRADFYDALFKVVPAPLSRVFMANSGSEANEAALKWARAATGRPRFVSAMRGFSGRTMGVLPLTWEKKYREPFEPLAGATDFIPYNNVEKLAEAVSDETAAVVLEPAQGEGGIRPATKKFLQAARDLTREHGALLIFDEIQTGAGRTGKFLACEHYGVIPDMVTMAKGLAGGVPIGALLMTEEVAQAMPKGGHGTTFGGNPLSAAAGLAVLEEFDRRDLMARAKHAGNRLRKGLLALKKENDKIREVRGVGLLVGLELKEKVAPYISALRDNGVLTINAGATVIRFVPPLVITDDEVDAVLAKVTNVLA